MTKSELIEKLSEKLDHLSAKDVEHAIKEILEMMAQSLSKGERIEIRGFGSFSLHFRAPRVGRNPKTGEKVLTPKKKTIHFKMAKELFKNLNNEE
jgi:integration host factor subunit beta